MDISTENYTIIGQNQRTQSNIYEIVSGVPQVFPFNITANIVNTISVSQVSAGQNGALSLWLSSVPLDQRLFIKYDWLNPVFVVRLFAQRINIYDQNLLNIPQGSLALDPTVTYYINVKNNEAKTNAYKLVFN